MKIVNFAGDKIAACFSFQYGNCEVRVSTIMNKDRAETVVFYGEKALYSASGLADAMLWVSDFGPRD